MKAFASIGSVAVASASVGSALPAAADVASLLEQLTVGSSSLSPSLAREVTNALVGVNNLLQAFHIENPTGESDPLSLATLEGVSLDALGTSEVSLQFLSQIGDVIRELRNRLEAAISELKTIAPLLKGTAQELLETLQRVKDALFPPATADEAAAMSLQDKIEFVKSVIAKLKDLLARFRELKELFGLGQAHGADVDADSADRIKHLVERAIEFLTDLLGKFFSLADLKSANLLDAVAASGDHSDALANVLFEGTFTNDVSFLDASALDRLREIAVQVRDRIGSLITMFDNLPSFLQNPLQDVRKALQTAHDLVDRLLNFKPLEFITDKIPVLKTVVDAIKKAIEAVQKLRERLSSRDIASMAAPEVVTVDLELIDKAEELLNRLKAYIRSLIGRFLPWLDLEDGDAKAALLWSRAFTSGNSHDLATARRVNAIALRATEKAMIVASDRLAVLSRVLSDESPAKAELSILQALLDPHASPIAHADSLADKLEAVKQLISVVKKAFEILRNLYERIRGQQGEQARLKELVHADFLFDGQLQEKISQALQSLLARLYDLIGRLFDGGILEDVSADSAYPTSRAATAGLWSEGDWLFGSGDVTAASHDFAPIDIAAFDLGDFAQRIKNAIGKISEIATDLFKELQGFEDVAKDVVDRLKAILDVFKRHGILHEPAAEDLHARGVIREWIVEKIKTELAELQAKIAELKRRLREFFGDNAKQDAQLALLEGILDRLEGAVRELFARLGEYLRRFFRGDQLASTASNDDRFASADKLWSQVYAADNHIPESAPAIALSVQKDMPVGMDLDGRV